MALPLHTAGVLRVHVVDAQGLREEEKDQDPYVTVERMALDVGTGLGAAAAAAPVSDAAVFKTQVKEDAGVAASWLESCDIQVGAAEAQAVQVRRSC